MANPLARPIQPAQPKKIGLRRRTTPKMPKEGLVPRSTMRPSMRPKKPSTGMKLMPLKRSM